MRAFSLHNISGVNPGAASMTLQMDGWTSSTGSTGAAERRAAAVWLAKHLGGYDELRSSFETQLAQLHHGHWYPAEPHRGSAYRCLHCDATSLDPLMAAAALQAGLSPQALHAALCRRFHLASEGGTLFIWCNPGEVKAVVDRPRTTTVPELIFGEATPAFSRPLRLKIERTRQTPRPSIDDELAHLSDITSDSSSDGTSEC